MTAAQAAPHGVTNGYERRRLKTRAAIIESAIALFQTQGVYETSLEDICVHAEVSVRSFFNHFETREHLHAEITRQRASEAAAVLHEIADAPGAFGEKLSAFVVGLASYLASRPAYRDFVGEMLQRHPARGNELVRSGVLADAASALVERGIEHGDLAPDVPAEALADLINGAVIVLISNWSADEHFDLEAEAATTVGLLGAIARPAPRTRPAPARRTRKETSR